MYNFKEIVKNYYNETGIEYNRFQSWEHCYEYFYSNKYNIDYDKAALMLFCYLASWGMLRNSFLMEYDYKLHVDLIKDLIPKYNSLWESDENSWNLICEADQTICNYYKDFKNKSERISDTLRTKILLGIFGCIPAYDRFFKEGISKYNKPKKLNLISYFGKNSYLKLWDFYNKQKIQDFYLHNNPKIKYPPMKLVDMYFWQIGKGNKENQK